MSDIEWDPTGRYLVTYVSNWSFKGENAYMLWNFQGFYFLNSCFIWRRRNGSATCKLLLDYASDPNSKNNQNYSPLD
jgi:uncharacterized protein with WD repeat